MVAPVARIVKQVDRNRRSCTSQLQLPLSFLVFYVLAFLLYLHIVGSLVNPRWPSLLSKSKSLKDEVVRPSVKKKTQRMRFGYASLNITPAVAAQQKVLCQYRKEASQSVVVHLHIPKSGGTAFAMALKSECRCVDIPRPQKGYCKDCPHVIPNKDLPVRNFTQNLWTAKNLTFELPFDTTCRSYYASSRWFGFATRHRTYTYYSQSRLTSGWPCGVHVGYARLRECYRRLQIPGVKYVMVTLFREPLARFVSEFYQVAYNRRVITSWDWCMNTSTPLSLKDFIGMPVSYPFQSRMSKLLSGSPIQTGAAGEDWRVRGVRERALVRALGVVTSSEDFIFGLAEEIGLTLEMFQFVFKRRFKSPSTCHSHQDKSGCRKVRLGLHDLEGNPFTLTEEEQKMFSKNNYEDRAVYDLARRVFWERVEAMRSLQSLGSDYAIDRRCDDILTGE